MPTSGAANSLSSGRLGGVPTEIRTLVTAVKGRCPGPLDDGDVGRAPLAQLLSAVHSPELHHFESACRHCLQLVQIGDGPARILHAGDEPEVSACAVGDEHAVLLQGTEDHQRGTVEWG